jgi:hypothetical protein
MYEEDPGDEIASYQQEVRHLESGLVTRQSEPSVVNSMWLALYGFAPGRVANVNTFIKMDEFRCFLT